jgi:hypothetical protein
MVKERGRVIAAFICPRTWGDEYIWESEKRSNDSMVSGNGGKELQQQNNHQRDQDKVVFLVGNYCKNYCVEKS